MTPEQRGRRSMKYQWTFAILFGGLVLVVGCATTEYKAEKYWQEEDKKLPESENYYRERVKESPKYPPNHEWLAFILYRRSKYEEALAEYRTIIQLFPNGYFVHGLTGDLLCQLGRWEEAEKVYQESFSLEKMRYPIFEDSLRRTRYIRGWPAWNDRWYWNLEWYDWIEMKEKHYCDSLGLSPNDIKTIKHYFPLKYYEKYGYALYLLKQRKNYAGAKDVLNEVLNLQYIWEQSWKRGKVPFYLACCYAALGKSDKAQMYFQMAVNDGFPYWNEWIISSELDGLRNEPRFRKMEATVKERWKEITAEPQIYPPGGVYKYLRPQRKFKK